MGSLVCAGPSRGAARPGAACVVERFGDAVSRWRRAIRTAFVLHQPAGEEGSVVEASVGEGGGVLVSAWAFALRWRKREAASVGEGGGVFVSAWAFALRWRMREAADWMQQCARALCVETACVETSCGELGHVCGPWHMCVGRGAAGGRRVVVDTTVLRVARPWGGAPQSARLGLGCLGGGRRRHC